MNPYKSLSWKSVVAIALLVAALPAAAQKRRAVAHPTNSPEVEVTVTGTVLDATTNAPVYRAQVRIGERSDNTDRSGKFEITTDIRGATPVTAGRSGYVTGTQSISTAGNHSLNFRLTPTPTATLKTTDGKQRAIDFESIEFGFIPPFGSYQKSDKDEFCKPGGTEVTISRAEMSRITGPAVREAHTACCAAQQPQKISVVLKSGETTPVYFVDSCNGYSIDLIARDHVTGDIIYTHFADVAEVIFP